MEYKIAENIFSRNMADNDEDITWRKMPGDDRKIIGDFACYYIVF